MAASPSPRKRPREFADVSSLDKPTDDHGYKANVHGVVTSVSPMKNDKFFDGYIDDGRKKLRLVGFSPVKGRKLREYCDKKQTVALNNCCVKNAFSGNGDMEVIVGDGTTLTDSKKTFQIDYESAASEDPTTPARDTTSARITLSQLGDLKNY